MISELTLKAVATILKFKTLFLSDYKDTGMCFYVWYRISILLQKLSRNAEILCK